MPDGLPILPPEVPAWAAEPLSPDLRPRPDAAPLETALDRAVAAARAGGRRGRAAWRVLRIPGAAWATLGRLLATEFRRRPPARERSGAAALDPMLAAAVVLRHGAGLPAWEQEAAAAAGVLTVLQALDRQGYGAAWLATKTIRDRSARAALRDPATLDLLGLDRQDRLLGWVSVGVPIPA